MTTLGDAKMSSLKDKLNKAPAISAEAPEEDVKETKVETKDKKTKKTK